MLTRELANFLGALVLTLLFGGVGGWRLWASYQLYKAEHYDDSEAVLWWGIILCVIALVCLFALICPTFYELTKCLPSGVVR